MELNFYLRPVSNKERQDYFKREGSKDMLRPIQLYISFNSERVPVNTKIKILESWWDASKQKASLKIGKKDAAAINIQLEEWEQKAIDFYEKYTPESPKVLKRLLEGVEIDDPEKDEDNKEFFKFFENYIKFSVPAGSKHNYEKCLVHLKSFSNNVYRITWEKLTLKFYHDYVKFLSTDYTNFRSGKKGILNSTMTKDIWTLKDVCKYARKNAKIEGIPFDVEDFEVPKASKGKRHHITEDRLKDLMAFDFNNWELFSKHLRMKKIIETKVIPNLLKVRDIYVFSFYTGQAHKELMKSIPSMVVKDIVNGKEISVLDFTRSKTKNNVAVPLNSICLDIIKKYKGGKTLLPYFVNSQYNRICKQMFKLAGFNRPITISRWSGDKEIIDTFEEWEVLTSHTGRHSAATNVLKKGKNLTIVRDMLGHKSIKTTEIYAVNDRETLNEAILKVTEGDNI